MVQKVITHLVSDLSGDATDVSTVTFSLGRSAWTVELTAKELARLEKALEPYIAVARKTPVVRGRKRPLRKRTTGASRGASGPGSGPADAISSGWRRSDLAAVRAWARENGWPDIADRGRVPVEVLAKYDAR